MARNSMMAARAAGFAVCLIAGTAAADMVVVQAKGPGLKPGQVVATGAVVTLPAASRAMLLSRDGRTVALTGPFSGPVSEPGGGEAGDAKTVTVLSRLLTAGGADSSALGVTRAADFGSPYAILLTGGAAAFNHCQVAGEAARFEREIGSPEERLTVTAPGGASETLVWAEDEAAVDWPAKLPLAASTYGLQRGAQAKPATLTIQLVPAGITGPTALAVWMAEHGCPAQAKKLLAGLR